MNRRDLEGLLEREGRQDSGEPSREHGLARAGRPAEKQMVRAGGRDFQRAPAEMLAFHFIEIERILARATGRRRRWRDDWLAIGGDENPRGVEQAPRRKQRKAL